jgi:hypothetical protein
VGIYTRNNTTNIIFTWVHNTNTQKNYVLMLFQHLVIRICSVFVLHAWSKIVGTQHLYYKYLYLVGDCNVFYHSTTCQLTSLSLLQTHLVEKIWDVVSRTVNISFILGFYLHWWRFCLGCAVFHKTRQLSEVDEAYWKF